MSDGAPVIGSYQAEIDDLRLKLATCARERDSLHKASECAHAIINALTKELERERELHVAARVELRAYTAVWWRRLVRKLGW